MENRLKLKEAAQKLVGMLCVDLKFGSGTGSIIKLIFDAPYTNTSKSEALNFDTGRKQELLVKCAWRLINQTQVNVTWRDIGARDKVLAESLNTLLCSTVLNSEYNETTKDLYLLFENGFEFQVLCDIANDEEADENYLLFSDEEILYVGFEGFVHTEQYEKH